MLRVLFLVPTTSYRTGDFLRAAERLGLEVTVGSEEPSTMEGFNPAGLLTLDFADPAACAARAREFARENPLAAVVGVDEPTAAAAAAIAGALGLPHNSFEAVAAAGHKGRMRECFAAASVPSPRYRLFRRDEDPADAGMQVTYPCVLKPTRLSASRGVIRADDPAAFEAAWRRIGAILAEPDAARRSGAAAGEILVEDFVPGAEVALEGLLVGGRLRVLALFDKPDPLEGPYFEETIYVCPSRLPANAQGEIGAVAEAAALALGLREGPIHAELRWSTSGASVIEIAARSIGGLCSRTLRFGTDMSLEELILRHALSLPLPLADRPTDGRSAGVMMIPIPRAGRFDEARGIEAARAVPGIEDVVISAHPGQELVPLPEGSRYLGFIFARSERPEETEAALREAHARLEFRIAPRE